MSSGFDADDGSAADAEVAPSESRLAADDTLTCELPSCVLSSSSAVLAAVSFSKVTVADCGLSVASEEGVTEREVILPLRWGKRWCQDLLVRFGKSRGDVPEAEEVTDFFLARVVSNVLDLRTRCQ